MGSTALHPQADPDKKAWHTCLLFSSAVQSISVSYIAAPLLVLGGMHCTMGCPGTAIWTRTRHGSQKHMCAALVRD
jgi:hypothetical protein